MKRVVYVLSTICFLMIWSSCRKDFDFSPSTGSLEFSKDTIYLDTVFTNIGSSTYNLKVYNRSNTDILIPTIRLGQGEASNYRLNVDGIPGKSFENVELLAKDSMYVFIETTIDIQALSASDTQFLYTDIIEFDSGSNYQKVDLVTLVKDAVFIYPNRDSDGIIETLSFDVDGDGNADETSIQGRFLEDDELNFTNEKPYVIYGYAAVDEGKTLTIDAGARVHFHANSGLLVTNTASLKVNGTLSTDQELLENEVIFEGDRLEPLYENIPGQWGTIWLFNGSEENTFNYATIKNAAVGILSEGNQNATTDKLTITNSQIYNSSNFGILGRATSITAENLVINNSGQSSFAGTLGGKYNFTHCTIANYWSNSFRQFPSLLLNNFFINENNEITVNSLDAANFNNCIIYGNDNAELLLEQESGSEFNYNFNNCLIRYQVNNNPINFNDDMHFSNIFLNQDPDFKNPDENKLIIGENSNANAEGDTFYSNLVPNDILGLDRTVSPDLGAYQHIIFVDED